MSIDQIISLSASIAACLSAIAAFLAVKQISKQREASFKPDIALARTYFNALSNSSNEAKIPNLWLPITDIEIEHNSIQPFSISLVNIGLGAAKNLTVNWQLPIEKLVSKLNKAAQMSLIPAYFEYKNQTLSIESENIGSSSWFWSNQKTESIDFLVPINVNNPSTLLPLPSVYIEIISLLIYFTSKAKNLDSFTEIPALIAEIHFCDIDGREHTIKVSLNVNIIMILEKGEKFSGYIESKYIS